ncbi:MAG: chromosome segregation protein SMC [Planctomycetia bacterium]|nr:chromosome segregation protein SMC [Planctomycetia bacterium]
MLKTIEISGFKSFADRTKMEFSEGISAIIGPNGSGKSNIVDAIKWVLGEQSIKKLRGNEMTDVIFNGSNSRSAVNTAEVTLSFDNSNHIFNVEAPEIHLTRRIYRSGESEYLVNRQASRLKDFREILSGTGLGAQAYSIIEQGRVETLLQSSSIQRRTVFEEAAGIAKFNSKKQEVQRRLERVEQNLLRLSDIVNEVESQLRNIKSQAGKAQIYRQLTTRLQELRIESSLIDWEKQSFDMKRYQTEIDQCSVIETELDQTIKKWENELLGLTLSLDNYDKKIRQIDGEVSGIRERIAAEESTVAFQMSQIDVLQNEIVDHGRQLLELNTRSGDTDEMLRQTDDEIFYARKRLREISENFAASNQQLENDIAQSNQLLEEKDKIRKTLQEKNIEGTRLSSEINSFESRLRNIDNTKNNREQKLETLRQQKMELTAKFGEIQGISEEILKKMQRCKEVFEKLQQQKKEQEEELEQQQQELNDWKQRQSGLIERVSLLQDLFRKHEGLSPGVKEVLKSSKNSESPFRHAFGLVADLIRVNVEAASLIELALGPMAQYIVVSPEPELFRYIEKNANNFAGRVGFIWLDPNPNEPIWTKNYIYEGRPGVLGRADQFVETDPQFTHLFKRLLSRTWIVESIAHAKALYRESDGRTNFLTVSGECLASDGTLIVGPSHGSLGLITRRSELRSLSEQLTQLEQQLTRKDISIELLKKELQKVDEQFEKANLEQRKAAQELENLRLQKTATEERDQQTQVYYQQLENEIRELTTEYKKIVEEQTNVKQKKRVLDGEINILEKRLTESQSQYEKLNSSRQEHSRKTTNLKIELAKSEERLDFLTARKKQFEDSQHERKHLLKEHHQRYLSLMTRKNQTELTILKVESQLASFYAQKENRLGELNLDIRERRKLNIRKNKIQAELKKTQLIFSQNREKTHKRTIEVERIQQEQKTVFDRMKEDYGINLNEKIKEWNFNHSDNSLSLNDLEEKAASKQTSSQSTTSETLNASTPKLNDSELLKEKTEKLKLNQKEIDEIKSKLQKIGTVNLEAIEMLENLETRYTTLFNQFNDLQSARKSIQKIIERINVDSQRLFEETFKSVKVHFVELFQQLFGGGHADLVLESPEHPLESGIDIVVRPPGKELKSIMLMSGGEKTLTCVALLLAIFQYRPNPVCILDEVDAALDEGNVDRFVRVIKNMNTKTQFLIITHSKKTMTAAKTMYGVTMQESGISKLIAVQFDEVGEDGEIMLKTSNEETAPDAIPNQGSPNKEDAA